MRELLPPAIGDTRVLSHGTPTAEGAGAQKPAAPVDTQTPPLAVDTLRSGGATGARLLSYELLELVGSGGMGAVYKAKHAWLGRTVALKFIAAHVVGDSEAVTRFENEARAVGALDHPHIVRASDAGQHAGVCYLVTEFIEGEDAARLVARRGPLPVADACQIILQAALGLQHAHEHHLVHRDVKPSNLLIDTAGVTKLIDFGIARLVAERATLTSTGQMLGTLDYLAPEQATDSRQIDSRADIYSLGCTFYFLLTGNAPFSGPKYQSPAAKIKGHLVDAPRAISGSRGPVAAGVIDCLARMMAKDPDERFGSCAEIAQALAPYARSAQLKALVSDDPAYGLVDRAAENQAPLDQRDEPLPFGLPAAGQARRRSIPRAGAVGVLAMVLSAGGVRWYESTKATSTEPAPASKDPRTIEMTGDPVDLRPLWRNSSRSSEVQFNANDPAAPPARKVSTSESSRESVRVREAQEKARQQAARAASKTKTAAPAPARSTALHAPAKIETTDSAGKTNTTPPASAPPAGEWMAMPPDSAGGGVEYRMMRYVGSPPPGVDPSKMPPGMKDAMPPEWMLNQLPPFPQPGAASPR